MDLNVWSRPSVKIGGFCYAFSNMSPLMGFLNLKAR